MFVIVLCIVTSRFQKVFGSKLFRCVFAALSHGDRSGPRMREAGLRYLRRRSKTVMPVKAVLSRLAWAAWVKVQSPAFLRRWVYTDGVPILPTFRFGASEMISLLTKCVSTLAARRPNGVSGSPALLPPCLKFNKAAFLVFPTWFLIGGLSYRLVRLVKF